MNNTQPHLNQPHLNSTCDEQGRIIANPYTNFSGCPKALDSYPVIHTQPVWWGEMDAFNHLNNVTYYRYAESARITYLQSLGLFSGNAVIVLAKGSCQYLRPVTFPDTLLIGVRCQQLGNTSATIDYTYYSTAQDAVVATGEAVIVRLDNKAQQKQAWSQAEREAVLQLEARVGNQPAI